MKYILLALITLSFSAYSGFEPPKHDDVDDAFLEQCKSSYTPSNSKCYEYFSYKTERVFVGDEDGTYYILKTILQGSGALQTVSKFDIVGIVKQDRMSYGNSAGELNQEASVAVINLINGMINGNIKNIYGKPYTPVVLNDFRAITKFREISETYGAATMVQDIIDSIAELFSNEPENTFIVISCANGNSNCVNILNTDSDGTRVISKLEGDGNISIIPVIGTETNNSLVDTLYKFNIYSSFNSCGIISRTERTPCPAGAPEGQQCYTTYASLDCG